MAEKDDTSKISPFLGEFTDSDLESRYRQDEVHRYGRLASIGILGLAVVVMLGMGLWLDLTYFLDGHPRLFVWMLGVRLAGLAVAALSLWGGATRALSSPRSYYVRLFVGVFAVVVSYTVIAYLYRTHLGWSASRLWFVAMLMGLLASIVAPLRYSLLVGSPLVVLGVLLHGILLPEQPGEFPAFLQMFLGALLVGIYLSLRFNVGRRRTFALAEHLEIGNRDLAAEIECRRAVEAELRSYQEDLEQQVLVRTEEKLALEVALQAARRIEALGRMAGGVAHDFNNLLVPILDATESARVALRGSGNVDEDLDVIEAAAERARALTGQLLDFGRDQTLTTKRVVDAHLLVRRVVGLLGRMLPPGIELSVGLEATGTRVVGDESQLEMILLNLALNGRDAMPDGGALTLRTRSEGERLMIEVQDTGLGMDPETQARIFEPFFTTKRRDRGTGLGLASAYGVVAQHQGTIEVESTLGQGSTFRIDLPVTRDEVDVVEVAEDEDPGVCDGDQYAVVSVDTQIALLLVDDEELARTSLRRNLRLRGYDVTDAASGEEALDLARAAEGRIQILITDMVMPGMNGRELWETLSAEQPQLRVIFTSGFPSDGVDLIGLQRDHVFLQKPYSSKELVVQIQQVIGSAVAQRA